MRSAAKPFSFCSSSDSTEAIKLKALIKSYNSVYHCTGNPYQNKNNRWIGWLLTAFAISLGAPFWFDLLNKFISARSTGKKPVDNGSDNNDTQKNTAPGSSPINRVG